jgi:RNA polymerase sigma-70 factor (ECF subfamily)
MAGSLEVGPPSFESLYRASLPFVHQKLWWLGVEPCDVDDLTQEIFLVVHRRLPSYDPRFSMKAWLGGIAWRVARNHQGSVRKRAEEALPDEDEPLELASPEPGAEQAAAQAERSARLRGIVQRLEPDLRVIFVMHEIEGISMDEIAKALGIPRGTAWSRQRRAVAVFKEAVRRQDVRTPGAFDVAFGLLPGLFAPDVPELDLEPRAADAPWARFQASAAETTTLEVDAEAWDALTQDGAGVQEGAAVGHMKAAARRAGKELLLAKAKSIAVAAGLVLGGAGTGILADRALHPRDVPVEAARLELESAAVSLVSATVPPLASALPAATPAAPSERSTAVPSVPVKSEGGLFRRAERAFDEGRTAEAVALLEEHARRSPHGPKAEQREVLLCRALLTLGRRAEAVARADRLRAAFPDSASLATIDAMLQAL